MVRKKLARASTIPIVILATASWIGCNAILGLDAPELEGPDPGACAHVECPPPDGCHEAGTCDPATGACSASPLQDGTRCDDGDDCTQVDACRGGACVGSTWLADGAPCDDGDSCTPHDSCQNGACLPGATCPAIDACHAPGACDPATRTCSTPALPDETPCDDQDACTQTDTCQVGVCVGADPVVCPSNGPCFPGLCDPASGACSNDPLPDGAACDDGDVCTTVSTCTNAICNPDGDRRWAHWPPEAPEDRVITPDVVIDNKTGRTWQRVAAPQKYTWLAAISYCSSLSVPEYPSGWRLPTRIELLSITDLTRHDPAIDTTIFPGTPSDAFWTSLPFVPYTPNAWVVHFNNGRAAPEEKTTLHRVRCVR